MRPSRGSWRRPACTITWFVRGRARAAGSCVESGDAREVHHFSLLIGYGAGAINPYLAFETIDDLIRAGHADRHRPRRGDRALHQGAQQGHPQGDVEDGDLDAASYRGAQIFEAIGLDQEFIDQYFTDTTRASAASAWTSSRRKCALRHERAFGRSAGRRHGARRRAANTSGAATASITSSTRRPCSSCSTRRAADSYTIFKEYTRAVNDQHERRATLRGLFELQARRPTPVPIDEVEPVERIVKRFATGAMSLRLDQPGSARDARDRDEPHRRQIATPAKAAKIPSGSCRSPMATRKRSAIKQVASGRFGVTASISSTPTSSRSRWRRAPSPVKAVSSRAQGLSVHRQAAALDARRGADLAAAASRHLFDRGSRAADSRPEERQPARADLGEARRRRSASAPSPRAWPRRMPISCSSRATTAARVRRR